MAKKNRNGEEKSGNKALGVIILLLIILVWIAAMVILIKMDVGHFGSEVLRPVLKDVPVINMILPAASDDEAIAESDYPYDNMADALARIKELEEINKTNEATLKTQSEELVEKDNEIARLKIFEQDQESFNKQKEEFYNEVVYGDQAPSADTYIEWYESIDAEHAEEIYRQVVAEEATSAKIKDLATTYAEMEPKDAAKILQTMGGDLDTVTKIMDQMSPTDQAEVLAEMDAAFAANITKKLMP